MKKSSVFQTAVVIGVVLASQITYAADSEAMGEVVVTATRSATPIEQVGSTVYVVTAKEIEQKQKQTVAEILETIPGVTVTRNGGIGGQATSVYLRGGEARHTLVLLNGIPLNDAASLDNAYDFSRFNSDSIERIEVLQGSQSPLYGSKAVGGVINIITKKSSKQEVIARAEAGSFNTFKEGISFSGGGDKLQYLIDLSQFNSHGITVQNNSLNKDGFRSSSITASASLTPDRNTDIDVFLKNQVSTADIYSASKNQYSNIHETTLGLNASKSLLEGRWTPQFSLGQNHITREMPVNPYRYESKSNRYSFTNILRLASSHTTTIGFEETQEESLSAQKQADIRSAFIQDSFSPIPNLYLSAGGRIDDHDLFGSQTTYRATIKLNLESIQSSIRGSYGTGFKAPSLYQLYLPTTTYPPFGGDYPTYIVSGNSKLEPEKSATWDIGIEKEFPTQSAKISMTYFHNSYKDLINFDETYLAQQNTILGTYLNIKHAKAQGLESSLKNKLTESSSVSITHTYTMTDDGQGNELLRRPKHQFNISLDNRISHKLSIGAELSYVGTRYDIAPGSSTVKAGSYYIVNVASSYDISKSIKIYARLNNLLDRTYQNTYTYNNPGIAAYVGLKASF